MVQTITTAETETNAGIMAQNILIKTFGVEYEHEILKIPEEPQYRKGHFEQDTLKADILAKEFPFKLYPNPNKGNMTLEYSIEQDGSLVVLDVTGKEMIKEKLNHKLNKTQISQTDLSNGLYLLRITVNGEKVFDNRVVIIR